MADRADNKIAYLTKQAMRWRDTLDRRTRSGRTVESLGPVVLGYRLNSSFSDRAWAIIAYDKGCQVFRMLARSLGTEQFTEMLGSLAGAVAGRQISTETFLKAIEKMSGADLSRYAKHYVYGTGIPEVSYNYAFTEEPDGRWLIKGTARQVENPNYRYVVLETEDGNWDVSREPLTVLDISDSKMIVPFQVLLEDREEQMAPTPKHERIFHAIKTSTGMGGNIVLTGRESPFEIRIEKKPAEFYLDQRGEVLAYFYSENQSPKKMLRYRGEQAATLGNTEEAEELFRRALETMHKSKLSSSKKNEKDILAEESYRNARLHLRIARLYLDRHDSDKAEEQVELAENTLVKKRKGSLSFTRRVLAARIASQRGDYREVFRLLEPSLLRKIPERKRKDPDEPSWKLRFHWGDGEAYALLAIGAAETGNEFIAGLAAKEAVRRGADADSLERLLKKERPES
jgi:hypothetical protein